MKKVLKAFKYSLRQAPKTLDLNKDIDISEGAEGWYKGAEELVSKILLLLKMFEDMNKGFEGVQTYPSTPHSIWTICRLESGTILFFTQQKMILSMCSNKG